MVATNQDWFALVDEADELIGRVKLAFLAGQGMAARSLFQCAIPTRATRTTPSRGSENYMRVENPDPRGYREIKFAMRVSLNGDNMDAKDIANAAAVRSQVGIDLHYL